MRLILILLLLVPSFSQAQQESRVAAQAREKGVVRCVARLDQITKHVQDDDAYAFLNTWSKGPTDGKIFNSFQIRQYPNSPPGIISLTVYPGPGTTCDAVMVQTFFLPTSGCAGIREKTFDKWKLFGELSGVPIYEHPTNDGENVALIPSGTGCWVIKNAVLYY